MSTRQYDLTEGGILRKLLQVAVPIMGTSFVQMAYNLTDMFWLGQGVSSEAVAASGASGMYLWLSMALLLVGRLGGEIGVSQNVGRKDYEAARAYAQHAILLAAALGVGFAAVLMLGSEPLIAVFGFQEASLARSATEYLVIVGFGVPFTFVSAAITGVFNGAGNSRLAFRANVVGLAVNMAMDPLLIMGAGWGVMGAAVATVFAQIIVCVLFVAFLKRHRERPFPSIPLRIRPDAAHSAQIFRWSLPACLESALFTLLAMATTRLVASFGGDAVTVQRVGSQVESLSWLIGGGFGSTVTSFVGQNYGAGKWSRIRRGYVISVWAMVTWGIVISLVLFLGGRLLYAAFVREHEIQVMGGVYLAILALSQTPACLESVSSSAFRGVGKTLPPAVVSISVNVLRVPLAYALAATSLGLDGVWWAISIGGMLRGVVVTIWYLLHARNQPQHDIA